MKHLKFIVALMVLMMFYQCEETLTGNPKTTYSVESVSFSDAVDQNGNGYASTLKFSFNIDVSKGTESVFVVIGKREHDASNNTTYTTYFTSSAFDITEDAKDDAKYITIGNPEIGELSHNAYDFLIQVYNAENKTDIVAEANMTNFSEMGNVLMETAAEDSPVRVQFNNKVFTDITVTINNNDTKVIPVADSVIFNFNGGNPGTINIYAETMGKNSQGQQLGEKVTWNASYDMTGKNFMKFNLNLTETMFFAYMKNTGAQEAVDWNPIYVNRGSEEAKTEDIVVPANGNTYRIGYYNYISGRAWLEAHWSGYDDNYSTKWDVTSRQVVNQAWIFSDTSTKKPAAAISAVPKDFIYDIGSSVPFQQNVVKKTADDAVNINSQ